MKKSDFFTRVQQNDFPILYVSKIILPTSKTRINQAAPTLQLA